MARNGVGSWRRLDTNTNNTNTNINTKNKINGLDLSDSEEVHVLAVDDSFVDRKVIERLLKISSCKVTLVDSGIRALQYLGLDEEQQQQQTTTTNFDGLKVDLIMTDYCMPGMTGYELLKKIKESSTMKQIPVVIMSSENIVPRIDRCMEEGAEDFIVKPVKLSDVERIKDYMMTRDLKSNKRKLRDSSFCCDDLLASSSPSVYSTSSSATSSPSNLSAPCSPTSLESTTTQSDDES
ncbi:hypothetical protein ACFE04_023436 [Oxalis oulophora]